MWEEPDKPDDPPVDHGPSLRKLRRWARRSSKCGNQFPIMRGQPPRKLGKHSFFLPPQGILFSACWITFLVVQIEEPTTNTTVWTLRGFIAGDCTPWLAYSPREIAYDTTLDEGTYRYWQPPGNLYTNGDYQDLVRAM